jgi:hypothetical protein
MTLSYLPDRKFRGRVTYIYPTVDEKTRTARVRMEFHNPGYFLKPGMFATVELVADLRRRRCWCRTRRCCAAARRTRFSSRCPAGNLRRAPSRSDCRRRMTWTRCSAVERRRADGHLRPVHARFGKPVARGDPENVESRRVPGGGEPRREPRETSQRRAGRDQCGRNGLGLPDAGARFDHLRSSRQMPDLRHDAGAGDQKPLEKLQPGGKILYYTCPMPEHSDVHSDKPGKCPKCGMTLIPVMEAATNLGCPRQ